LDIAVISKIKALLYQGLTQIEIASTYGISQTSISRIRAGKVGGYIPWPDGSIGALPQRDRPAALSPIAKYPAAIQERMLSVVNADRALHDRLPIPISSAEYQEYISSQIQNPEDERSLFNRAALAEDSRLRDLVSEFEGILQRARETSDRTTYEALLESTKDSETRPPPEEAPYTSPVYDALPLDRVLVMKTALLAKIKASRDILALEALCIAAKLHEDSPVFWASLPFASLVYEIREYLTGDIELLSHIKGKYHDHGLWPSDEGTDISRDSGSSNS
jgi:transcriptional regulator with XRE-family HTH domain